MTSGLRARATVESAGAMLSEIVVLVLLLFYPKRRGIGLWQIGLWISSPMRGWIAAAMRGTADPYRAKQEYWPGRP